MNFYVHGEKKSFSAHFLSCFDKIFFHFHFFEFNSLVLFFQMYYYKYGPRKISQIFPLARIEKNEYYKKHRKGKF